MFVRIAILALGTFAIGTDAFVVAGILPDIAGSVGVPVSAAGILVTAFALSYALGAPVLATVTGNVPFRRILPISMLLLALGNLAAVFAPSLATLTLARVFAALAAALYTPTASSMAALIAPPEQRGRALAIVLAGLMVANTLGVPLGTWVGAHAGWRMTFVVVAVLCGLVSLFLAAAMPRVQRPRPASLAVRLGLLGRAEVSWTLAVTLAFMVGVWSCFTFLAPLLERFTGASPAGVSLFLLFAGLGGILGTYAGGFLTDRRGAFPTVIASVGLLLITFLSLRSMLGVAGWAAAGTFLWGVAGAGFNPAQQHRLIASVPEAASVVLSLNSSAIYLGAGLGSELGSLVVRHAGLGALPPLSAAFAAIALAVLLVQSRALFRRPVEQAECVDDSPCP